MVPTMSDEHRMIGGKVLSIEGTQMQLISICCDPLDDGYEFSWQSTTQIQRWRSTVMF